MKTSKKEKKRKTTIPEYENSVGGGLQIIDDSPEQEAKPITNQYNLKDVVIKSEFFHLTPNEQTKEILDRFNAHAKRNSCFTTSFVRGNQIPKGEFLLGVRNNNAELHGPSSVPIARSLVFSPGKFTRIIGQYKQDEFFYGTSGSFVLNVPVGHYGLALSNNQPYIYDEGPHVIYDPTFHIDTKGIVKKSENYIHHKTLRILRVSAGYLAKIWLGSVPYILQSKVEPYVFNDPNFKFDPADGLVLESNSYINHGTIHILRVPAGKVALIWIGSKAQILEDTTKCYRFNDPLFRLQEAKKAGSYFYKATEQCIIHGSIKRIIPHTGQVAITYDNGNLKVYEPRDDGKPIVITSPNHQFICFLNTGVQTLEFPSKERKRQRLADNRNANLDEITYDVFTTRDSLKIGVKLAVVYRIKNPTLAITHLGNMQDIEKHIETVATVDMGKAIQKCTSQEFLSFNHNNATKIAEISDLSAENPFVAPPDLHYQDEVKKHLAKDLKDYGIELVRLNVETPKIMDTDIQKQLENQSVKTAQANAEEAILEQNYRIAKKKAEQEAETKRIAIEQQNNALKSSAQAKLDAAKLNAEAAVTKAEGEKRVSEMQGTVFNKNELLYQLEYARIVADVFSNARLSLTSSEMASIFRNSPLFNQSLVDPRNK